MPELDARISAATPIGRKGGKREKNGKSMKGRFDRRSLLWRIGLIMALLSILALSSMTASVIIGRALQGKAMAVNLAGSLRMQSYLIATRLLIASELDHDTHWQLMQGFIQSFENRLYRLGPASGAIGGSSNEAVRKSYEKVRKQWGEEIRPILDAYVSGIIPVHERPALASRNWGMISDASVASLRERYLSRVERFVANIDSFVKALSLDSENRIRRLRYFQWMALGMTIAILLFALLFARRRVIQPLKILLASAEAAGNRDFSQRTGIRGDDELGRLGSSFDDMAGRLSQLYGRLEEQVRIKTRHLERSNRSLNALYKTVRRLSGELFPHAAYQGLLEEVTAILGCGPAVICLTGDDPFKAHQLASSSNCSNSRILCENGDCRLCLGNGEVHFLSLGIAGGENRQIISLPIGSGNHRHGVLLAEAGGAGGFEPWQQKVLEAVASNIAMAISMSRLHAEQNRCALLDERSAIARELHDSIAQSLSYARIQLSRLRKSLNEDGEKNHRENAAAIIKELGDGLAHAYGELRELISTFRLNMEEDDLSEAIRAVVEEFSRRGGIIMDFIGDCPSGLLSPGEEIHVLQIAREALSNMLHHSGAKRARVSLRRQENGAIQLLVEDDGCGIGKPGAGDDNETHEDRDHHGLSIMHERAARLGARLHIGPGRDGRGTCISLLIMPGGERPAGENEEEKAGGGHGIEG